MKSVSKNFPSAFSLQPVLLVLIILLPLNLHAQDQSRANSLLERAEDLLSSKAIDQFLSLPPERINEVMSGMTPDQTERLKSQLNARQRELLGNISTDALSSVIKGQTEPPVKEAPAPLPTPEIKEPASVKMTDNIFDRCRSTLGYQVLSTDLTTFGHDFFAKSTFDLGIATPESSASISPDYLIGPGDEILVRQWGRVQGFSRLTVDREGFLTISGFPPKKVTGMRYDDVKKYIRQQLSKTWGTKVRITMGRLKTMHVYLLGEVHNPGMYAVESFSTITNALIEGGGPTAIGSLRKVELRRNNETVAVFDFYDLLLRGDRTMDKMLQAGDIIFVPTVGPQAGIAGNVKRPAIYELKNGLELNNLIKLAGGFLPCSFTQQIQVERIKRNERHLIVDIDQENLTGSGGFVLEDGDMVKVFSIVEKAENFVTLSGNLKKPGRFEYRPGMRIRDIITEEDLLDEPYLKYALIKRRLPPDYELQSISFNLGRAIFGDDGEDNIELKPRDSITVFSKWLFQDRPSVTVTGQVRDLKGHNQYRKLELEYRELNRRSSEITGRDLPVPERLKSEIEALEAEIESRFPFSEIIEKARLREIESLIESIRSKNLSVPKSLLDSRLDLTWQLDDKSARKRVLIKSLRSLESLKGKAALYQSKGMVMPDEELKQIAELEENVNEVIITAPEAVKLKFKELRGKIDELESRGVVVPEGLRLELAELKDEIIARLLYTSLDHISVPLYAKARVRDAVLASGGLAEDAWLERSEIIRLDDKRSEIQIFFNLGKAMSGDPQENIILRDEDRIIIHSRLERDYKREVAVEGEVTSPGDYPLSAGMKVSDLIFTAGNLLESAYLDEAELSLHPLKADRSVNTEIVTINLKKALADDPKHNLPLNPNDRLFVKRIPGWGEEAYINLSGEVRFPGVYLVKKGERLSSIVGRAGGFTPNAYLRGAVFTRESVRMLQQKRLNEMVERLERELVGKEALGISGIVGTRQVQPDELRELGEKRRFIERLKTLTAKGRISIAVTQPHQLRNTPYDLELKDGDKLFVPTNPNTVYVAGAVYNTNTFLYDRQKNHKDYINIAGGYTEFAEKKHVYVLKVDGTAVRPKAEKLGFTWNKEAGKWKSGGSRLDLEPGDTVVVPLKVAKINWLRQIADATQVLQQIALITAVFIALPF